MLTGVLRAANLALGAGLVLLGLALAAIPVIDTGHAPDTDAFRLIQFHFVLTGAAALLSAAGRGPALTTVLLLLGAANLAVGWMAAEQALYWPLLLGASSALAFVSPNVGEDAALAEMLRLAEAPLNDLPPTDYGMSSGAEDTNAGLAAIVNLAVISALGAAVTFFGGAYVDLLIAAIALREPIDIAEALRHLDEGAVAGIMAQLRGELIGLIVAGAVIGAGGVFWSQMLRERIEAVAPDFDRALSPAERNYIRDAYDALAARFGEAPASARRFQVQTAVFVAVAMTAIFAVLFLGFAAERAIGGQLAAARIGEGDPVAYDSALTVGAAMSSFALLPALAALLQFAGGRFPSFGRQLFAAGWITNLGLARAAGALTFEAARQVRRRMLDVAAAFDIDAFLDIAFREYASLVYKTAAAFAAAAAFLVAADLAYFRIADETGVRYSNYGRFVEQRATLAELDRVELGCIAPDAGERFSRVRLSYVLVKDGAFRFDIFPDYGIADRIDRFESFDRALADAGVPVMRAVRADLLSSRPGYSDSCAEAIAARYDADIAPRLIRLMRADGAVAAP